MGASRVTFNGTSIAAILYKEGGINIRFGNKAGTNYLEG